MKKVCYIDIETTGLNPHKHGIIQIAGLIEIDGKEVNEFNYKLKPFPEDEVDKSALKIAGVEQVSVLDAWPSPIETYIKLTRVLESYVDKYNRQDKMHLVGYNIHAFDVPFLIQFFRKNNNKYFHSYFFHPSLDVQLIAAYVLRHKRREIPKFSLADVAKFLGVPFELNKLHDALYDVRVTKEVYLALVGYSG